MRWISRYLKVRKQGNRYCPSSEFWRALLRVHHHHRFAFLKELEEYRSLPWQQNQHHVLKAMQIVDCWLDVAIQDGWLEDYPE